MVVERKILRSLLTEISSDDEFNSYIIDNFPHVFCQFSSAMSRTQRINILFEYVDEFDIAQKLQRGYFINRHKFRKESLSRLILCLMGLILICFGRQRVLDNIGQREGTYRHAEELVDILNQRAQKISKEIEEFGSDKRLSKDDMLVLRKQKDEFEALHAKHISALRSGQTFLAHEELREIHKLLGEIDQRRMSLEQATTDKAQRFIRAFSNRSALNSSYMVIAMQPEHPSTSNLAEARKQEEAILSEIKQNNQMIKTGFSLKQSYQLTDLSNTGGTRTKLAN